MNIRPKTNHEIIADIAAYGEEALPHLHDRSALLKMSGQLAITGPPEGELTRITPSAEQFIGEHGRQAIAANTERSLGNAAVYTNTLRAVNRTKRDEITGRRELLEGFGLHAIDKEWGVLPIGKGDYADVDAVSVGGRVITQRSLRKADEQDTDDRAVAAIRAKRQNIKTAEKLIGVTYEAGGRTRSEYHAGTNIGDLPLHELREVTPQQVTQLAEDIVAANFDIDVTIKPDNILYDAQEGFRLVDTSRRIQGYRNIYLSPKDVALNRVASYLALGRVDKSQSHNKQDYALASATLHARLPIIEAFRDALAALPPDAVRHEGLSRSARYPLEDIVAYCDSQIEQNRKKAAGYSDDYAGRHRRPD